MNRKQVSREIPLNPFRRDVGGERKDTKLLSDIKTLKWARSSVGRASRRDVGEVAGSIVESYE